MANKKIPMRQCVGCGQMKEKKMMFRIIHTPEDTIVLDSTGKKNGRGAYICPDAECLAKARRSKGLSRSFKMAVPDEIYEQLEKEMENIAE